MSFIMYIIQYFRSTSLFIGSKLIKVLGVFIKNILFIGMNILELETTSLAD